MKYKSQLIILHEKYSTDYYFYTIGLSQLSNKINVM